MYPPLCLLHMVLECILVPDRGRARRECSRAFLALLMNQATCLGHTSQSLSMSAGKGKELKEGRETGSDFNMKKKLSFACLLLINYVLKVKQINYVLNSTNTLNTFSLRRKNVRNQCSLTQKQLPTEDKANFRLTIKYTSCVTEPGSLIICLINHSRLLQRNSENAIMKPQNMLRCCREIKLIGLVNKLPISRSFFSSVREQTSLDVDNKKNLCLFTERRLTSASDQAATKTTDNFLGNSAFSTILIVLLKEY